MKYKLVYSGYLSDGCGGEDPDGATIEFDAASDSKAIALAIEKVEMISLDATLENAYCMHHVRSLSIFDSNDRLVSRIK